MKLSERLVALLALAEATDDAERDHNAPDAECVFVDVRPAEFEALLREAADLARRIEGAAVGVIDQIGDDESGQPRVTVHSTREELANSNARPFQRVALVPLEGE